LCEDKCWMTRNEVENEREMKGKEGRSRKVSEGRGERDKAKVETEGVRLVIGREQKRERQV